MHKALTYKLKAEFDREREREREREDGMSWTLYASNNLHVQEASSTFVAGD